MIKDAYYFSHDSNARHDPKLVTFCQKHTLLGYAYFFIFVELMREQSEYRIPKKYTMAIASSWGGLSEAQARLVIQDMLDIGLICEDDQSYYSQSLMIRMEALDERRKKLSEAGKKGGLKASRGKARSKRRSSQASATLNPEFERIWQSYPKPIGKANAQKAYEATVKTPQDKTDIWTALASYKSSSEVRDKFAKNGDKWFAQWRDWHSLAIKAPAEAADKWKTELSPRK